MVVKLFEMISNVKDISIQEPRGRGNIDAFVVETENEYFFNFLDNIAVDYNVIKTLRNNYNKVTIVKTVDINSKFRGFGVGNLLLTTIIKKSKEHIVDAILIVADNKSIKDFEITEWYKKFGFDYLTNTRAGPLMIRTQLN